MSGQGVPTGNYFNFYNTNRGAGFWSRTQPPIDWDGVCSLPGHCGTEDDRELQRCSLRYECALRDESIGVPAWDRPPTLSTRDVCKLPDIAWYYDPVQQERKEIVIPQGQLSTVVSQLRNQQWRILDRYQEFTENLFIEAPPRPTPRSADGQPQSG
ncbi:hypothetical protein DOTSEDRAFT_25687 [Dothistroma septosporum NZE10]|uniref:Uncharacterized protein n=1 Tax=Dothistroma septosporum (strain NZE10 / CBS 128990) TaxID=675120 RepID=N1PL41_DOTSN|nr:hypothetical protein DOTSEDRAFT_25687 [Dothistroma septosporum NZE10]